MKKNFFKNFLNYEKYIICAGADRNLVQVRPDLSSHSAPMIKCMGAVMKLSSGPRGGRSGKFVEFIIFSNIIT